MELTKEQISVVEQIQDMLDGFLSPKVQSNQPIYRIWRRNRQEVVLDDDGMIKRDENGKAITKPTAGLEAVPVVILGSSNDEDAEAVFNTVSETLPKLSGSGVYLVHQIGNTSYNVISANVSKITGNYELLLGAKATTSTYSASEVVAELQNVKLDNPPKIVQPEEPKKRIGLSL